MLSGVLCEGFVVVVRFAEPSVRLNVVTLMARPLPYMASLL